MQTTSEQSKVVPGPDEKFCQMESKTEQSWFQDSVKTYYSNYGSHLPLLCMDGYLFLDHNFKRFSKWLSITSSTSLKLWFSTAPYV